MKKLLLMKTVLLLFALVVGSGSVWADNTPCYTLDTSLSANAGTNSAYASEGSKEVGGITWYATGNMQTQPWRIGGKASTSSTTATLDVSRTVYTGTPMEDEIESIKLYIGDVTVNTFTSVKLTVSSEADFSSITDEITKSSPSANSTLTFNPTSGTNWDSKLYYKFTINATLKGKSNSYVQFSKVEFYEYTGGSSDSPSEAAFSVTAPSINFPATTTYTQAATTAEGYTGTITYEITANTAGATLEGTTLTVTQEGSVTVKATAPAITGWAKSEATYTLTVNDTREEAELSFAEDAEEITWGDTYTGQALTNAHSLPVTWSSTDETVATVSSSGVVDVLKAGSTEIKASFAGNATYKSTVVAYTLTVKKAPAGLSYTTTSFNIKLNDDTFEAPTLNNPNGLTVTYASNNADVATVNTSTGVLAYVASAVGTAKITASFAGNDNYYSGSANYTINIVDPTVKGCVFNPYTVAEVIELNPTSTSSAKASDVYVTGYIVGCCNTSTGALITESASLIDSNLALADDPSNTSSINSVQLSNNTTPRIDFNVKNHPDHIGTTKILIKGDVYKYCGIPGLKNIDEMSAVSFDITIAGSGYSSLGKPFGLDFANASPAGLEAYVVPSITASAVSLSAIDEAPASTGVILKGTASAKYTIPAKATAAAVGTNYLKAAVTATPIAANEAYIMQGGLFHKVTAASTIPAGKAYLLATDVPSEARELNFVFDDVTAIETVKSEKANNEYYNLAGQRVANPTKGLYIVNGRKVVVK